MSNPSSGRPEVVVTGIGLVTPAGRTTDQVWQRLLSGRSTAAPITRFDASSHRVGLACEVSDLDVDPFVTPKEARRIDRVGIFGIIASATALADALPAGAGASVDAAGLGCEVTELLDVDPDPDGSGRRIRYRGHPHAWRTRSPKSPVAARHAPARSWCP